MAETGRGQRQRRNRQETDQLVFDAVRRMLTRDGALAGMTLQTVADEAGVNRVQLYQNFGSKQALLRAAILHFLDTVRQERESYLEYSFVERRRHMFAQFLKEPEIVRLEALLAQDKDEELKVFPDLNRALAAVDRDIESGHLPDDADGAALHVVTAATYMGYCIFRDVYARSVDIPAGELDDRVLEAFTGLLSAYSSTASSLSRD